MHDPADADPPRPADEPTVPGAPAHEPTVPGAPAHEPTVPAAPAHEPTVPGAPAHEGTRNRTRLHRAVAGIRRWWQKPPFRWTVAVVALVFVLEYLLLPDLANARKSLSTLGAVNVVGLLVGVALEAVALVAYAELTHTVLLTDALKRSKLLRINMSTLAVSHVVPGGTAPGTALAFRLLTEEGVPSGAAAFGLATQGVGSAVVLNAIFWLALFISIPLTGYNPLYGFAALVGLVLFTAFAAIVILLTRGQRRGLESLRAWAAKVPLVNPDKLTSLVQTIADRLRILLRDRALLVHALEWAAANWLFDAASLWVFVFAFGKAVSPVDLLVAFGLANVLAVIPVTPSGLGVVEGVLIPTLVGFGVPTPIATLGVLSYRLVNFWLPIPAGGACYLTLRFGRDGKERRHERTRHDTGRQHDAVRRDGARHEAARRGVARRDVAGRPANRTARRMRGAGPGAT